MRQLFVPACLCLMTFSGSTGTDSEFSLEQFTGRPAVNKRAETPAPQTEASSVILEIPARSTEDKTAVPDDVSVFAAVPSDRPIEIPEQTAIEPVLEPQLVPLPPIPKPVVYRSRQEVCDTLIAAAQSNDLPVPFFIRLLFQESGFQPDAVSRAGAQGVAQFMPETAASVGLDNPFDPREAILASARLLRNLFHQFGNLGLAAAAYNAGPGRIQAWLAKKGKLPQETQGYVKTITGRPAENWKLAEAGTPEMRLPRRAPCQEAAGLHAWNGPDHIPMPVPSPKTVKTVQTVQTVQTVKIKTAKTVPSSAAKAAEGAVQLAARKSAQPGKRGAKAVHPAQTGAAKPRRFAAATHGTHK